MVSVYVLLGEHDAMVDTVANLEHRGLMDTGEYAVIFVDFDTYTDLDPMHYARSKSVSVSLELMLTGKPVLTFITWTSKWGLSIQMLNLKHVVKTAHLNLH